MNFFNFHTHNKKESFGIINLFPEDSSSDPEKKYSIGYHPWYYSENYAGKISLIKEKVNSNNIVAVGETGFDPKSPVNIEIQQNIFTAHVEISELSKKPLIIHCVKYYNELVVLKKKLKPLQPWILHGFAGKIGIVEELVAHDFYFSVSENLLKDNSKSEKFFKLVSIDRIFFETDDKDLEIETVYERAATLLNLDCNKLSHIIGNNLQRIGI